MTTRSLVCIRPMNTIFHQIKGVLILPQSASSDAAATVSSFINAGIGLDSIEVKTSLTSNDVRLYLGYDALAENGLKIQAINSAVRFGEEQTSVYTFAINPALSNGSINLVNSDYFNVVGKTAVFTAKADKAYLVADASGKNKDVDGLIVEMSEADYAAMFENNMSDATQVCLYFSSDEIARNAITKLPDGYMGLLSTSKIYVQSAGDVFTSDVLLYVALIAVSLLIGVLIGIIFMRSVKIFEADFAVYRTLGIPNKVSSRSLYVQMALIFLPALVLLPLVSLIATVIQGSSLSFISFGNYFFIEVMLLLIVEIVAFGFNKSLNGKSIRKTLRRGVEIMIRIENVGKVFNPRSRNRNEVLKGVSFELPEKGLVAIYGKSGSGKTTLLNIIGGLDKQDKGKIYIDGENVAGKVDKIRNAKIGFFFQNYYLERGYTIAEIMCNAMHIAGFKDEAEIERRSEEVLTLVDMERFKNKQGDALSGGQKQRVAIARALIKGADIILADEPTGNLDAENTMKVMDILKEISRTKLVVIVTHEITLGKPWCNFRS